MKAEPFSSVQTDTFQIQPASLRDVFDLYRLEKQCFPIDSWPFIDVLMALIFPRIIRLKAVSGGELIGFAMGEQERNVGWIATIGVAQDFRRRGVGRGLLDAVEGGMNQPTIRLCVRISNEPAIDLYERSGYRAVKTWRNYYRGGEDALVMEKSRNRIRPASFAGL